MWRKPLREQLCSAKCFFAADLCFVFIWSWQDSNSQSLVLKTNALSTWPQDRLVTSQATITKPLPELPPPRQSAENASNHQVLRVVAGIIFEMCPAPRKAFTKCLATCDAALFKSFHKLFARRLQCFCRAFTGLLRGFHRVFHILQGVYKAVYRDCARPLTVFSCLVQSCYIIFSNAAARILQVFFTMFFTWSLRGVWQRCLQGALKGVHKVFYRKCLLCLWSVFKRFFLPGVCKVLSQYSLQGAHKALTRLLQGFK